MPNQKENNFDGEIENMTQHNQGLNHFVKDENGNLQPVVHGNTIVHEFVETEQDDNIETGRSEKGYIDDIEDIESEPVVHSSKKANDDTSADVDNTSNEVMTEAKLKQLRDYKQSQKESMGKQVLNRVISKRRVLKGRKSQRSSSHASV